MATKPEASHYGNDPMGAPTTHRGPIEDCPAPECQDALIDEEDPRQPAYDAVFAYIRSQPRDFLPTTVVARNALIWRAVHTALDAMGAPRKEGT